MNHPLKDIIVKDIEDNGPMGVDAFMALALGHSEHGYYMSRDPIGAGGDFTTAPEVSQMFGEMIGAWAADVWAQMGEPSEVVLLECGPGRGTLMADIMRSTQGARGFYAAVEVCLLETSSVLKAKQAEALAVYEPKWFECVDKVPNDKPLIVIGNEFLDALPFQQFIRGADGWKERVIDFKDGVFCFDVRDAVVEIPFHLEKAGVSDIYEYAPHRIDFIKAVGERIQQNNGGALFIDYGHVRSTVGDTFQAVKDHKFVDVLSDVGEADLTSHVDFEALVENVKNDVHGPVKQGEFLRALGIEVRAEILLKGADEKQAADIKKALHRLTGSREMGDLFKVIGLSSGLKPHGFK